MQGFQGCLGHVLGHIQVTQVTAYVTSFVTRLSRGLVDYIPRMNYPVRRGGCGEIGKLKALKMLRLTPCGFEPRHPHHISSSE